LPGLADGGGLALSGGVPPGLGWLISRFRPDPRGKELEKRPAIAVSCRYRRCGGGHGGMESRFPAGPAPARPAARGRAPIRHICHTSCGVG